MDNTIRVVAALIRDEAWRVLLVRKRGTAAFMQPGGKRDAGEDDLTALARELDEELGCRLIPASVRSLGQFDAVAANEPGWQVQAAVYAIDIPAKSRRRPRSRRCDGSIPPRRWTFTSRR